MSLTIGNKSLYNAAPGATTITISHNQNTGDGRFLMVSVVNTSTFIPTGVTYNGVSMTLVSSRTVSDVPQWMGLFALSSPATGSNDIVVSYGASMFNGVSVFGCSFTNSDGYGNFGNFDSATAPNSQSLTVSSNSIVFALGISSVTITDITIDGSIRPHEFDHNTNNLTSGALSLALTSGSKTVSIDTISSAVSNFNIEILETAAVANQSSFLMLF
jgi:hypothetical protein